MRVRKYSRHKNRATVTRNKKIQFLCQKIHIKCKVGELNLIHGDTTVKRGERKDAVNTEFFRFAAVRQFAHNTVSS